MRRKHLARLGRAPANGNSHGHCNRRDDAAPATAAREMGARAAAAAAVDADDPADPDRPGFHGGVPCPSCGRKLVTARRHQDRQLWLLARELCASATLFGLGGRAPVALRSLQLACTMLRDRSGSFEPAALRD